MKIGILGAPGACKAQFAIELAGELQRGKENRTLVLDGYVEDLRLTTGLEYGLFGNHLDDLQITFKRREWELAWACMKRDTITCGTILDSIAHYFVRQEDNVHNPRELVLTQTRLRTIAETFGMLYTDTWDYDYAFYLPYKGEDPNSRIIDTALVELMRSYAPPILSFKSEVSDDKKAEIACITILALEADQLPQTLESGVRPSEEHGEDDGDSSGSMSDMPEQGNDTP